MAQISWRKHLQDELVLVNGASAVELQQQSEEEPTELPEQEPEEESSSRSPEEQEPKSNTPEGFYNNSAAWPHLSMVRESAYVLLCLF